MFLIFQKHLNKSTRKINSYFGIIAQIWNTSKAELAVYFTSQNAFKYRFIFILADTE